MWLQNSVPFYYLWDDQKTIWLHCLTPRTYVDRRPCVVCPSNGHHGRVGGCLIHGGFRLLKWSWAGDEWRHNLLSNQSNHSARIDHWPTRRQTGPLLVFQISSFIVIGQTSPNTPVAARGLPVRVMGHTPPPRLVISLFERSEWQFISIVNNNILKCSARFRIEEKLLTLR